MESIRPEKIAKSEAKALIDWARKTRNLLVDENDTPIKNCELIDIKLQKRNEDEVFLTDDEVYHRVRRGNCIVFYTKDGVNVHKVARKGLIKFFDYKVRYKNRKDDKKMKERVLENIREAFDKKKKVVVYLSEKANGENLQIAYEYYLNAWIIASKNVTILCRDREDIQWYKYKSISASKYSFCIEFAELWFDILEKKIISLGKLEDFVKDIAGFTLVGENIGDPNHQHIQMYTDKDIVFYSMVKNDSDEICLSLNQSREILTKYGLSYVKINRSREFETFDELKEYMAKVYEEVLLKDVEQAGEGEVAYFASVDSEGEEIISLAKLKTFDYRFLRKLREKLKTFGKTGKDVTSTLKKIETESKELLGEEGDEVDLDRYMKLAEFVLNFVKRSDKKVNYTDHYACFIHDMKNYFEKSKSGLHIDQNTVNNINNKYNCQVEAENVSEIKIDTDVNIQDLIDSVREDEQTKGKKGKKGKKTKEKESLPEKEETNKNKKGKQKKKKDEEKEVHGFIKGPIYFLLNFGLVAGGKSTLLALLQEVIEEKYKNSVNLMTVSSDKFRRNLMDSYIEKHPGTSLLDSHSLVDNAYKYGFNREVIRVVNAHKDENKINLMYVDKNFFPGSATGFFRFLKEDKDFLDDFEILVFHPNISYPMADFPFSWSYFIQAYYRLKNRKDHETLDSEKHPYPHYILISFLKLFHEGTFHVNNNKFSFFPITFTDEKDLDIPTDIQKLMKQIYKKMGKKAFEMEHLKTFDETISKFFSRIENEFPASTFKDTREIMHQELDNFLKERINN